MTVDVPGLEIRPVSVERMSTVGELMTPVRAVDLSGELRVKAGTDSGERRNDYRCPQGEAGSGAGALRGGDGGQRVQG